MQQLPLLRQLFDQRLDFSLGLAWLMILLVWAGQSPASDSDPRVPWTSSRIVGSPEPPLPYVAQRAFPNLKFNMCLDIVAAPGSERLFVVEQGGKVFSFPDDQAVTSADLVIDFAKEIPGVREVYSLAFHPDFQRNRYVYVCYIEEHGREDGTHVARFTLRDNNPPTIDVSSELTILTWWSGGHNGCHLLFGPDGYLYISAGDATGPNPPDDFKTGQDLSDIPSSILRIDVDRAEGDRNYRIPPDNPFIDLAGARPEIWAYGLRNPWRMSFDRQTGDLWCGDVGWELWEMLHRIERGGNYGWSIMEGPQPINTELPRGPTPILPPVVQHPHSESSSITDGLTYYGQRLPELHGTHVYSDYDTGKFWGIRFEAGRVVEQRTLADTTHRVVGFGEDRAGELYFLDHTAGTIHTLIENPLRDRQSDFPVNLSQTGLFQVVNEQQLADGVIPYRINAQSWADHASAQRWVAIPGKYAINTTTSAWSFPTNSVLVKTLSLDTRHGDASSRQAIETQILHFDGQEWLPYTYRWHDDQTDATLVSAFGDERVITIEDASAPGGKRVQHWQFAGRAECQRCHNKYAGSLLGFTPPQLNYHAEQSQLAHFAQIQLLTAAVDIEQTPQLADPHDQTASLEARARAYLHVNCGHCHRMSGGGSVLSFMHHDLSIEQTNLFARPSQGDFGIEGARVIAPGDPYRSVLPYRLAKLGGGRMPRLSSTEVDAAGFKLICDWIAQLPPELAESAETSETTQTSQTRRIVPKTLASNAPLRVLTAARTEAEQVAAIEQLLRSTSGALAVLHGLEQHQFPVELTQVAIARGSQHAHESVRDLFERFLPPEARQPRLGNVVQPQAILSLAGDTQRGRQLFFETPSVSCKNCHRLENQGVPLGPDLSAIAAKLNATQLLESILEPSKVIEPQYRTYLISTNDGQVLSGLLVRQDEEAVVLKNALNEEQTLAVADIEQMRPQSVSLMPELLLREMSAQQVADLLAYLSTLK